MTKDIETRNPREELTLLLDAEICDLLSCSAWTLGQWRANHGFPRPIFITDGSPRRTPLGRIQRWLDSRERRRRRVVHRGALRKDVGNG